MGDASIPSTSLTGTTLIRNPVGAPLGQVVSDRASAQSQRELERAFYEANQRAAIETGTNMARSRLDEFAQHGAFGHSRSALWHAAALGAHAMGAVTTGVGQATSGVIRLATMMGSGPGSFSEAPVDTTQTMPSYGGSATFCRDTGGPVDS